MFGLFNADAIESAEFYKGAIPARYGGALSGVLATRQRVGPASGSRFTGGLSMLGLRVSAVGGVPWADTQWMVAGRRATIALSSLPTPYSFQDVNLGFRLHPGEEHRVGFSLLATNDEFDWAFDPFGESLHSEWSNLVSSVTWSWVRGNRLTSDATAYMSRYNATLGVGAEGTGPVTRNRVGVVGVRGQLTVRRGERTGARAGIVAEGGPVTVRGTGPGAYIEGETVTSYLHGFLFAEVEQWIGPLRLGPGLRVGTEQRASRTFVEPRLSARLYLGPLAVSASLDRTYQFLSTLRDDRFVFPGTPMWSVREQGQPIASADGISVAVDYWRAERWTGSMGFWTRRLRDTPHWRPETSRDLSALEYHDGRAYGWELSLQRHAGPVRGWASYQWASVTLTNPDGRRYSPNWDRRHEFDATVSMPEFRGWSASVRTRVATGTPFWYPAGAYYGITYNPTALHPGVNSPDNPPRGLDSSDWCSFHRSRLLGSTSGSEGVIRVHANVFRILVAASAMASGGCRDVIRLDPPPILDDRLVVIAALDPDSLRHPLVVWPAEVGRPLSATVARLYRARDGSQGLAWTLVDTTMMLHDDDICGPRYSLNSGPTQCLAFEAALEPGSTYRVEVSSEGRTTARGETSVVGPFSVESALLSGSGESAMLTASWTSSQRADRYVVSVRQYNVPRLGGEKGWFTDAAGTSITTLVPEEAIRNALQPPTFDVVALDANLWAYMTTGNGGEGFSIPPVQNVDGGFGVVGSFTFRSRALATGGGP